MLSLKFDLVAGVVHVTRAIHCHAWEGYHAGDNVYLSRETQRWVNELVGSLDVARFSPATLTDELVGLLFQAVVGVSRLPLTSVEAPLPDFSLGKLGYCDGIDAADALHTTENLLDRGQKLPRAGAERSRLLELLLRATPADGIGALADALARRWGALADTPADFLALLRRVFDEVALSPHTGFSERALALLPLLVERGLLGAEAMLDFLSYLLRHLARHLTAYDLITFHHQGANYPDALLLDAALKMYLRTAEASPKWFVPVEGDDRATEARQRIRRRALRQGWLLRRFYEGLPVPDAPTSPGENSRILPPPHVRVPEEQFDPEKRTRRLYAGEPLALGEQARAILRVALDDLALPSELQELGTATFLDRPLGAAKPPGETDRTMLFSMEAFSRPIAGKRLEVLLDKADGMISSPDVAEWRGRLRAMDVIGIDLPLSRGGAWPGKVSLDDARKVARDVRFLRISRRYVEEFLAQFDFAPLRRLCPLDFLAPDRRVLLLRGDADATLVVYDAGCRKRLELQVDGGQGYEMRFDGEYPAAGLRVLGAWSEAGEKLDVGSCRIGPVGRSPASQSS